MLQGIRYVLHPSIIPSLSVFAFVVSFLATDPELLEQRAVELVLVAISLV